jgi:signal transduction histidine kinase
MLKNNLTGLTKKKVRLYMSLFFIALAVPTAVLIQQSYSRLKWEAFHQQQLAADELARRIDNQFIQLIATEELRAFTDYSFLNVAGDPAATFFQRSPLSHYPVESEVPGMIGYFQVDALGQLVTPLMPKVIEQAANYGITDTELAERTVLHNKIQSILSENRLVKNKQVAEFKFKKERDKDSSARGGMDGNDASFSDLMSEGTLSSYATNEVMVSELEGKSIDTFEGQAAFDDLRNNAAKEIKGGNKLGRLEDLQLAQPYQQKLEEQAVQQQKNDKAKLSKIIEKRARKEQSVLPETLAPAETQIKEVTDEEVRDSVIIQSNLAPLSIQTFASEIEPFEFSQLESGHFVLFRQVWLNEQRYIQGILIENQSFLSDIINQAFRETALSQMTNLLVAYQGNVLEAFRAQTSRGYLSTVSELNGELLYQTQLSAPLNELQLLFSITQLPAGPGSIVIIWLALILAMVLCVDFYLMYRLSLGQINLANQQQDFVSSVSHELKTPLTSIRMYGEMLREGWASEEKKKSYYDFIFDESERLSRLINNVLLMAKLTRNSQHAELKSYTATELIDGVRSKLSTQIERAGFELNFSCDANAAEATIEVDEDWFSQIMINLVDNAIKFSAQADSKLIELSCQYLSNNQLQFKVRDHGPGINKQQKKKIFQLFYRSESELTRKTVGTGIGLALVHQMIVNMNGKIDVVNTEPGAEFRVQFPTE